MKSSIIDANDTLELRFYNKKIQRKTIFCYIRRGVTIFDIKKAMLTFFGKDTRNTITDFRLVTKGEDKLEMNDTIKDNFFDEQYNNDDAYDHMLFIINSDYYKVHGTKNPLIYFRIVKSSVNTKIYTSSSRELSFDFNLAIENNSYFKWENKVKEYIRAYSKKYDDLPFHPFQNTKKLDDISKEEDMKKYSENGLILFLFPIKATFVNNSQRMSILLKFDKPLSDYITEIAKKLQIKSDLKNLLFQIRKDDGSFEKVDPNSPIHKILQKQKTEPVIFDILDITPNIIHVKIPFDDGNFADINFEYKNEKTINDLAESLKAYFNIEAKFKLLQNNTSEAKSDKKIKDFPSLLLTCSKTSELSMTRLFKINKKDTIKKPVLLDKKVSHVMKEIANEFDSHQSLVTLKLDKVVMDPHSLFSSYFIPPKKEILVEVQEFSEFITLKIHESKKSPIEIRAGFTPKMKLKELKEKVPSGLQSDLFFFLNDKLDETKTFKEYGIINNQTIDAYASKFYLYKYKKQILPISADTDFTKLEGILKSNFKLPNEFFINQNGKPLTEGSYLKLKLQNGTMLEIITPTQMLFLIDNEFKVKANSKQQVKDIIAKLSEQSNTPVEKIQLFNEQSVPIRPESYLYSSFIMKEKDHTYKIQSKTAKSFTFQNCLGKYFNESFILSMKIGDVLTELKNSGKKIEKDSFIIFNGQVIDNNATLASLIPNKKEEEEEEDQLLIIENEMPKLINIKLIFQFGKESEDINDFNIKLIKPTEALNVRYWASVTCGQPFDMLSLAVNDNILNDDDNLENDTDVIVTLCSSSNADQMEEQAQEAIKQTASYISKKIDAQSEMASSLDLARTQKISEIVPKKVTESSDESELDDFSDEEDTDPFAKGNGTYGPTPNGPEDEYIFKFKIINGEDFDLQLPCDISVKDIKEKIAESRDTEVENITIFAGNQRLADFNRLTNLYIPKQVHYFSVKIIDLKNTLVCTRVRLRK